MDYNTATQVNPQTESTTKPAESSTANPTASLPSEPTSNVPTNSEKIGNLSTKTQNLSLENSVSKQTNTTSEPKQGSTMNPIGEVSDFKAMAADASVFSFGDDEDYESDWKQQDDVFVALIIVHKMDIYGLFWRFIWFIQ